MIMLFDNALTVTRGMIHLVKILQRREKTSNTFLKTAILNGSVLIIGNIERRRNQVRIEEWLLSYLRRIINFFQALGIFKMD